MDIEDVAKTTWVQEVQKYFLQKNEKILIFDIDQEIQKTTRQTIEQMFKKGESYFRKIENETAFNCFQQAQSFKGKVFISLGAGYTGKIPSFCSVIHLKRPSDSAGRVFLDRPRLLPFLEDFDESQSLYLKRKLIYKQQRDFVFTKLDYFKSFEKWDEVFFGREKLPFRNGLLTLSEKHCPSSQEKLNFFLDQRLKWGLKYFELKDDKISNAFLKKVLLKIPPHQMLLSFRQKGGVLFKNLLNQMKFENLMADWPVEWGDIKNHEKISWIYSLHKREHDTFKRVLEKFPKKKNVHLKLAVEIFSFEELWQGHLWQKEDPCRRSFHPRSQDGRWKWYRLLFGPHQPLYFIREDYEEGVLDQPVMAESVRCGGGLSKNGFACVLGDPIEHSATPFEQQSFFEKYNLPIVSILMKEEEVHDANIKILKNFGMKFSAITSPLKRKFYQLLPHEKKSSKELAQKKLSEKLSQDKLSKEKTLSEKLSQDKLSKENKLSERFSQDSLDCSPVLSVNTLILTQKGWSSWNTDSEGALAFEQFIRQSGFRKVLVWGGGAVREVLDFVFSAAYLVSASHVASASLPSDSSVSSPHPHNDISFYSAQTGKLLKGSEQSPEVVIWAVGRSRMSVCMDPPQHWKPLYVLDLNYTEDSPGRAYAVKTKSQYVSGWLWFKAQAQAQRILFEKLKSQ